MALAFPGEKTHITLMNDDQISDAEPKKGGSCCGCGGHERAHGAQSGDPEALKTFDMYHFFSRKDVIAVIVLLTLLLSFVLYKTFFVSQIV